MGKIIKSKIRGMNLWVKAGLVLTLTLLVSVFLYQGWYQPQVSQANYQSMLHNSDNLGTAKGVWGVTGGRYGAFSCATCHSSSAANFGTNIKRIRTSIIASGFTAWSSTKTATLNIMYTNTTSLGRITVGSGTSASRVCEMCHTKTAYHKYDYTSSSTHSSQDDPDCTKCHPHNAGFKPTGGACPTCHNTGGQGNVNGRAAITPQFDTPGNSHHVQLTSNIAKTACYACHWEADATGSTTAYHKDGKVNLAIYSSTRPTVYTLNVTAVAYSSGRTNANTRSEVAKINNHCLGCHSSTSPSFQPFGDGNTPRQYSWEANPTSVGGFGAARSIASKYTQTGTTPWSKTSGNFTNAKSGQTKALAGHGNASANQRGWAAIPENLQDSAVVANYPNTSGSVNVLCYDCHNAHGSGTGTATTNAVTSSYSSATGKYKGGLLKNTTAGYGGFVNTYRSYSGGNSAQKNVYTALSALCFDCHNNASSGAFTSTGYTTPWGYQGTFGSSAAIFGFNDAPYFGKNGATFGKTVAYPWLASHSANMGGHFGASTPLQFAPSRTINGMCTKCHDPHGVTPALGTNQQFAVPMLKNTFITSPYKMDTAGTSAKYGGGENVTQVTGAIAGYHIDQNTFQTATNGYSGGDTNNKGWKWNFATAATSLQNYNDTQFAGLCMTCHSKANINGTDAASSTNWRSLTRVHNSVKGWASTGGGNAGNVRHSYTCSKCHTPHNSRLPRLLITNCLDVKHKGRVVSGGTMPGPLSISNSSGNGLGRFPGGGASATWSTSASAPGPWFFGTTTAPAITATQSCHDSATAAGATFVSTLQMWNNKSSW